MLKKISFVVMILLLLSFVAVMAHGDEKHKKKIEKVSTAVQVENELAHSDSLEQAEENEAKEKDFAQIRQNVENSTVPTVVKALSLAAFIAGLAFLYLPRRKKENSNGE